MVSGGFGPVGPRAKAPGLGAGGVKPLKLQGAKPPEADDISTFETRK